MPVASPMDGHAGVRDGHHRSFAAGAPDLHRLGAYVVETDVDFADRAAAGENQGMQGSARPDRQFLDASALCAHLVPAASIYAFLAEHHSRLFPPGAVRRLVPLWPGPAFGARRSGGARRICRARCTDSTADLIE